MRELAHPALARAMKREPVRRLPIDDARYILAALRPVFRAACIAIADHGPERHVEKICLELVHACVFFKLFQQKPAIALVIGT